MPWFEEHGGPAWAVLRRETFALLQRDRELREVAGLVGPDALEDQDRLILETARLLREFLIGQSAYDPADASSPVTKTWKLADTIHRFHRAGADALSGGGTMAAVDVAGARRALEALRASPEGATP